jgi:hypothetical protein
MEKLNKRLHLMGNAFKVILVIRKGVPSVGNKTAGTYLTLGMTCYSLPRELKAGDMIHYTIIFPNMEWLTYGIPIPGYSTYEDIKRVMISSQIQSKKFLTNK